ncbi:MAG: CoA transferase [Chloroflexota bacterium]
MGAEAHAALPGVRVLEYGRLVAAPYAGKLLADLGADVIKVEDPCGDPARRYGPFPDDRPHPEHSGLFMYLNTNKRGVTLTMESVEGRRLFAELADQSDLLIEDAPPGHMASWGLDYATLHGRNPRLVVVSITPFGQTGPYAHYKAHTLTTFHASGEGMLLPNGADYMARPPVTIPGFAHDYDCGMTAAVAGLAALYHARATGHGQRVDISKQEAAMAYMRQEVSDYVATGEVTNRANAASYHRDIAPSKDGYITIHFINDKEWETFVKLMGNPEWTKSDKFKDVPGRKENHREMMQRITEWTRLHTKLDIYASAQALHSPTGVYLTPDELLASPQYAARDFFVDITDPSGRAWRVPRGPCAFSETPFAVRRPAPRLGEHNDDVLCGQLGVSREQLTGLRRTGVV